MLVLSRKIGEQIQIGDDVTITVVRLADGAVRIGIEAPSEMLIVRQELGQGGVVATSGFHRGATGDTARS